MRRLVVAISSSIVLTLLLASHPEPAAARQATTEDQSLTCKVTGASCSLGSECCSKFCCSMASHFRCVTSGQSSGRTCSG